MGTLTQAVWRPDLKVCPGADRDAQATVTHCRRDANLRHAGRGLRPHSGRHAGTMSACTGRAVEPVCPGLSAKHFGFAV